MNVAVEVVQGCQRRGYELSILTVMSDDRYLVASNGTHSVRVRLAEVEKAGIIDINNLPVAKADLLGVYEDEYTDLKKRIIGYVGQFDIFGIPYEKITQRKFCQNYKPKEIKNAVNSLLQDDDIERIVCNYTVPDRCARTPIFRVKIKFMAALFDYIRNNGPVTINDADRVTGLELGYRHTLQCLTGGVEAGFLAKKAMGSDRRTIKYFIDHRARDVDFNDYIEKPEGAHNAKNAN